MLCTRGVRHSLHGSDVRRAINTFRFDFSSSSIAKYVIIAITSSKYCRMLLSARKRKKPSILEKMCVGFLFSDNQIHKYIRAFIAVGCRKCEPRAPSKARQMEKFKAQYEMN